MIQLKQFIITVLLLIAFGLSAIAQISPLTPYEGATHSYAWNGLQGGVEYEFYLSANADGTGIYNDGLTAEFDFVTSSSGSVGFSENEAACDIVWNEGASLKNFFVWVRITNPGGCSNYRYVGVNPQPNNRSIGFDVLASTECFNLEGNHFNLPFNVLDASSQSLSAAHFPLLVKFTVNGVNQSQTVSFESQRLQISETMFAANPIQNTDVVVEITNAVDTNSDVIVSKVENATHVRTLFAIPEIEFTEELRIKYNLNEEITAYINNNPDRAGWMEPK